MLKDLSPAGQAGVKRCTLECGGGGDRHTTRCATGRWGRPRALAAELSSEPRRRPGLQLLPTQHMAWPGATLPPRSCRASYLCLSFPGTCLVPCALRVRGWQVSTARLVSE